MEIIFYTSILKHIKLYETNVLKKQFLPNSHSKYISKYLEKINKKYLYNLIHNLSLKLHDWYKNIIPNTEFPKSDSYIQIHKFFISYLDSENFNENLQRLSFLLDDILEWKQMSYSQNSIGCLIFHYILLQDRIYNIFDSVRNAVIDIQKGQYKIKSNVNHIKIVGNIISQQAYENGLQTTLDKLEKQIIPLIILKHNVFYIYMKDNMENRINLHYHEIDNYFYELFNSCLTNFYVITFCFSSDLYFENKYSSFKKYMEILFFEKLHEIQNIKNWEIIIGDKDNPILLSHPLLPHPKHLLHRISDKSSYSSEKWIDKATLHFPPILENVKIEKQIVIKLI